MINFVLALTLANIGVMVGAVCGHLIVAYKLAPRRAKEGLMDALISDDEFQVALISTLIKNLMREVPVKLQDGTVKTMPAVDPVLHHGLEKFNKYLEGKSGKMMEEVGKAATLDFSQTENPLLSMALSQIPKKYVPYVHILMRIMQGQQQPEY